MSRVLIWVGTVATAGFFAGVTPVSAEDFSGHWHLIFSARCLNAPSNRAACAALQGPARFAVFGVTGTSLTVRGVGDYVSDREGRYTVRFWTSVTEQVPGAERPRHCADAVVFDEMFSGSCVERGTGRGHIAPGRTGMPDFWQDSTRGVWAGAPPVPFATDSPTDTFNPACPGTLDTKHFLALFGFRSVPAGISGSLVLTHRR